MKAAAATGFDPSRAVQVLADHGSGHMLGSGYQVTTGLVLTAQHAVAAAQTVTVRFIDVPGRAREVAAHVIWAQSSVDLAVLRLAEADAAVPPVRYGRLIGAAACEAVGYPWFKLRAGRDEGFAADADAGVYRESHHARGTVTSHSNRRAAVLELAVTAPLAHPDPTRSAWEGMSGAAVFSDGLLVGVISENYAREGPAWLTARPVTSWYFDSLDEHFVLLHNLLALPGQDQLSVVGQGGAAGVGPRQLPPDTALFTGRESELEQLLALAGDTGSGASPGTVVISAIDGMGGVGKTSLAVRAAHRLAGSFPDGQLFLDLYGFTRGTAPRDPGDALAALLGALGVPPQQLPAEVDARAALYRDRLAGTRTLVVLDNAADETQVTPLLPASDGCLVLVTSRRRLAALDDAVPLQLDALPIGEAVALLHKAARLAGHPADHPLLAQAAERCGRLPLALLIAGALLRTGGRAWNLAVLIDRLSNQPPGDELAGYTDETRSLSAVFELSYQHLSEDLQLLFRRIGLLPGSELDLYAAAALLEIGTQSAARLMQRLADHSLLTGVAPGRYRFHDLIRAYARTLAVTLDPEAERTAALDRLLSYYAHAAHDASRLITRYPSSATGEPEATRSPALTVPAPTDPETALSWLRTEQPHLDAAFSRAHAQGLDRHVIALAAGLAEILRTDGPWTRALEIHQAAADAADRQADPVAHADALSDLGRVLRMSGDHLGAGVAHARAGEIYSEVGNRLGEANALNDLGRVQYLTSDHAGAEESFARALETYQQLADRLGEAGALIDLGGIRFLTGDYAGAEDAFTRALGIYRKLAHRHGEADALAELGRIQCQTGNFSRAEDALVRALEIHRAFGNRLGEARALVDLSLSRSATGDHSGAEGALVRALEILHALGHRNGEAMVLTELGNVRIAAGDYSGAGEVLSRALEIHRVLDNRLSEAVTLTNLGRMRSLTGDHAAAEAAHNDALALFRALDQRANEAWALNHYAAALAASDRRPQALQLYQEALTMLRELGQPDDEAIALEGIGDHYLATGDPAEGVTYLRQALEIYRRLGMSADAARVESRFSGLAERPETLEMQKD